MVPNRIHLAVAVCVLVAVSFAFGRYTVASPHVVADAQSKTVEVESEQSKREIAILRAELEQTKRQTHKETRTVVHPDGTRERTTVTDATVNTTRQSQETAHKTEETAVTRSKETEAHTHQETTSVRPDWRLGPVVSIDARTGLIGYGATVERRILGPISLGAFGMSSGTFGVSLTLEF